MAEEKQPAGDQVENLREMLPEETGKPPDANKPRIPFNTAYVLTREQEDALVTYAVDRLTQLETQLGRVGDSGTAGGRTGQPRRFIIPNPESFFGKRKKYSYRYYNHVQDRVQPNTIYEVSNLTASLSQRITMQMIARSINFFFGQPDDIDWFSTEPVGTNDEAEADKIRKHSRWKVDQCGIKYSFIDAMEYAFVRGEAIVKPTHQQRSQIYKRTATILVDEAGEPILDVHGDYIVQGDSFVPETQSVEAAAPGLIDRVKGFFGIGGPQPGAEEASESPEQEQTEQDQAAQQQPVPTGRMVLKRDGVTVIPDNPIWNTQIITRQLITFEGPESPVVYYEDFLCPENATDIQTADLIAHLYDMDVMKVAQMFRGQYGEGDDAIKNMEAAVVRIREMAGESNLPKSAAGQPRVDFKESDTAGPQAVPLCQIAECYLTYDADGDGIQEEIMLVLDRANKAPIYYEYLANVTVRGLRPFFVWRPMPVDQRWYGMGSMELFDGEQEFLDLEINRHNFAQSSAGKVVFWTPGNTAEGRSNPNLKYKHGQTYSLIDGKKAEETLSYVETPFDGENLEFLINLFMQLMQTKSGVVNSADQNLSGLPSNKLATGINEIQQSGEELFNRLLAHLFPGVKETLRAVIDIIYANMNRTEIFNYLEGDASEVLALEPQDVRDLALNVTLELSRTQKAKAIEISQAARDLIDWYIKLPPENQANCADFCRQLLKGFGVSQADKVIQPAQPTNQTPDDKPSAVANAIANLMKSGAAIGVDDINAVLQKMGMPPISANGQNGSPPTPNGQPTVSAPVPQQPIQSAV